MRTLTGVGDASASHLRRCSVQRLTVLVALALLVEACATTASCPPLAMLDSVVVAHAAKQPGGGLVIIRDAKPVTPAEHLPLQRGDILSTDADTFAIVSFAGARVRLNPGSQVQLGSLLADFGDFLVSGWLKLVDTKTVSAKSRGTKYHVQVDRETQQTTITVLEGQVTVRPKQQSLEEISVAAGQRVAVGRVEANTPHAVSVSKEELNALIAQLVQVERPRSVLPYVVGLELDQAIPQLAQQGLSQPDEVVIKKVPGHEQIGRVIEQLPVAGVYSNAVTLTVVATAAWVPNLIGKSASAAVRALQEAGLSTGQVDDSYAINASSALVVEQAPLAGQSVLKGDAVGFTLAVPARPRAQDKAQTSERTGTRVPDVTGVTPERALAALRNAGFSAQVEFNFRRDIMVPRVLSQDPFPNQSAGQARPIRLVVLATPATPSEKEGDADVGATK